MVRRSNPQFNGILFQQLEIKHCCTEFKLNNTCSNKKILPFGAVAGGLYCSSGLLGSFYFSVSPGTLRG